jgi:hypothetical protein
MCHCQLKEEHESSVGLTGTTPILYQPEVDASVPHIHMIYLRKRDTYLGSNQSGGKKIYRTVLIQKKNPEAF